MGNKKNTNQDPFEEYQRESDPSKRERSYAWHTAIGLQAVGGLENRCFSLCRGKSAEGFLCQSHIFVFSSVAVQCTCKGGFCYER